MIGPAARPGLVVFSPLPPMRTGIADYCAFLLPLLDRHYRCTVVVEDGIAGLRAPPDIPVLGLAEYEAAAARLADDLHLYHLGNNPDHVYMLPTMIRRPGVVVLHDPGLHHLLDCATAALGDLDGYGAALEAEYGAPGRVLADQFRDHELRDRLMLYGMPMLRQLLGPARHVITHSRFAAHRALSQAPDTPVTVAPHPYAAPAAPLADAARALRRRWGVAMDEVLFLSLGFVSHIKRIDVALRAIARIAGDLPPFRYVIAGELRAEEMDVPALVRALDIERHVVITGYVPDAEIDATIAAADVVINLRHPVGGETSGTLIRALGHGACVIVVDAGPFAELPNGAAVRLPWGPAIETDLAATLRRLAGSPAERRAIGATAARDIGARCHPDRTLDAYRAALAQAAATPGRPWRRATVHAYAPPQETPQTGPLWRRLAAAPHVDPPAPALLITGPADLAALRLMGHIPVPGAWDDFGPHGIDFAFIGATRGAALLSDPSLLARLNRVLSHDGVLVVSLRGIAPDGHALAARGTGTAALRAAGFRVDVAASAPPPSIAPPARPAGTEIVWRATKISDFIARSAA